LDLKEDGMETLLFIGKGDLRKVINCLQITSMSNPNTQLTAACIFLNLGLPLPAEMQSIFHQLMEDSFEKAFKELRSLQKEKGYSVDNIVSALYQLVLAIDWPNTVIMQLVARLADIEERLSFGASEEIQLAALVSSFVNVRHDLHQLKKILK
ncbi:hypothetical protein IE077_001557, partial [Cardiosporidium cionae]